MGRHLIRQITAAIGQAPYKALLSLGRHLIRHVKSLLPLHLVERYVKSLLSLHLVERHVKSLLRLGRHLVERPSVYLVERPSVYLVGSKVSQFEVKVFIQHTVLWFDVPMEYT